MVVATPIQIEKIREVDVPVIDLSCKQSKVAKLIVKACEEYGFFKVINHGVPHHIIKNMEDESFQFFDKPLPEKMKLVGSADPFGYGSKNIGLGGDRGELEYLLLQTNQNAIDDTSKCRYAVSSYVDGVRELACELLELMAKGLGVPPSSFSHFLKCFNSDSLLRLNHYPPVTHTSHSSFQRGIIGFGEHSDPQILTLLASNFVPGLQISLGNGVWVPVSPDPLAFCVNIGDVLQAMTNGRFVSVRHRAMANSLPTQSRLSMVFFGAPPPEATIVCPLQLLKQNKPVYRAFTWAEYKSHTYAHRLGEVRLDHFKISDDEKVT
ncbi:gibberellin 2-beta-dioxygenase 2-like [Cynara cardunculus var. scolymus]|uniref:gibberellin 2-beta-dioxygenase 2-like n=1 Tax=Cynara cardunculus var. scolymus TaxID=59895 RepID=UPI000D62F201|nr:gibberellin 2-beta-dioxygenase 2-like [Cynara cardunculus var. scolymus]